jgi:GTP-binding protein HflX
VDSASADRDAQIDAVNGVLEEIGAAQVPQILVWNKIDATAVEAGVERDAYGKIRRVRVSARTGVGLELLRQSLAETAQERAEPASPVVNAA